MICRMVSWIFLFSLNTSSYVPSRLTSRLRTSRVRKYFRNGRLSEDANQWRAVVFSLTPLGLNGVGDGGPVTHE